MQVRGIFHLKLTMLVIGRSEDRPAESNRHLHLFVQAPVAFAPERQVELGGASDRVLQEVRSPGKGLRA
jgi:hypothetical protein